MEQLKNISSYDKYSVLECKDLDEIKIWFAVVMKRDIKKKKKYKTKLSCIEITIM